jgi:hypothetical protein
MMSLSVSRTVVLTGEKSALDPKLFRHGSSSCYPPVARERFAIALEQRRGALFYQLCTHLNWIDLYPINPHSLSSFRLTFFSSRAKDDPIDGQLLEELVRTHRDRLRPYQPAVTTERQLDL